MNILQIFAPLKTTRCNVKCSLLAVLLIIHVYVYIYVYCVKLEIFDVVAIEIFTPHLTLYC